MKKDIILGHTFAFLSVLFWSSLYVSTKILLESFTPLELLVLQFCMGYILLLIAKPKRLKLNSVKEEIYFALAGLTGITIYNLFLNLAMSYSLASNVSVIIAAAPLFTGIFTFILKIEKPYISFFIGFIVSMIGITILSFNGQAELKLNPLGDILAVVSSIGWGLYSVIIKKITDMKYDIILYTRRVIFYGIIFMLPSFLFLDFNPNFMAFKNPVTLFNMIFVATFASGICFIIWNKATDLIGAIKTNIYVYLTPVITIFVSIIVLKEHITLIAVLGVALTLSGVIISELRK